MYTDPTDAAVGAVIYHIVGVINSFQGDGQCPPAFVFADATGWTINANYLTKSIDLSFLEGNPAVISRFETSVSAIFQLVYNIDGLLPDGNILKKKFVVIR